MIVYLYMVFSCCWPQDSTRDQFNKFILAMLYLLSLGGHEDIHILILFCSILSFSSSRRMPIVLGTFTYCTAKVIDL